MSRQNRAELIEEGFLKALKSGDLPKPTETAALGDDLPAAHWVDLFESQLISRHLERTANAVTRGRR